MSYWGIIGAVLWRGTLLGGAFGALYATIVASFFGTPYGFIIGAAAGAVLGIADGLFIAAITWLCRPVYLAWKFILFCTVTTSLLTFIGALAGFSQIFYVDFLHIYVLLASVVAAVVAGWANRRVAVKIAQHDQQEKVKRNLKMQEIEEDEPSFTLQHSENKRLQL